MARNYTGFKWKGTISKDKYISVAHPYDPYKPYVQTPPPNKYASFGSPINQAVGSQDSSVYSSSLNAANLGPMAKSGMSAISALTPVLDSLLSPAVPKSQGDFSADSISSASVIFLERYLVDDLDEVARIYESNGYAVTRYIQGSPLSVHNRQMYDYIQCDEVNVTGTMDGMALEDIKARLTDGIRMWHTNEHVLVCESSPFNIAMGQLCVKDNTEV